MKKRRQSFLWMIISVHHAASSLTLMWTKQAKPDHTVFKRKEGGEAFPHLEKCIHELDKHRGTPRLSNAEGTLLFLFKRLNSIRNQLMHRLPPDVIDTAVVSFAAMSMVGMYRAVAPRRGATFEDLFKEFPENRKVIVDAIHYSRHKEYLDFVEALLCEEYPGHHVNECPNCLARTVLSDHCKACFENVKEITCKSCDAEFLIVLSHPLMQSCPVCGQVHGA